MAEFEHDAHEAEQEMQRRLTRYFIRDRTLAGGNGGIGFRELAPPPLVLDVCCGPRSFWFDKADDRALFVDRRMETHAADVGTPSTKGRAPIVVEPDVLASFTALPFADESFPLVVFDPPHAERSAALGFLTKRYGHLTGDWRTMLRHGFEECFRVLTPQGTLVFKWGENDYPVLEILGLSPHRPLFGHKTSKTTVWAIFMKPPSGDSGNG